MARSPLHSGQIADANAGFLYLGKVHLADTLVMGTGEQMRLDVPLRISLHKRPERE